MAKKKKKNQKKSEEWDHIPVKPHTKRRFLVMMKHFINPENPKITQDGLVTKLMDIFENKPSKPKRA